MVGGRVAHQGAAAALRGDPLLAELYLGPPWRALRACGRGNIMIAQAIVDGILSGAIVALGAIGITFSLSILRFANFSHGDLLGVGAYGALAVVLLARWRPRRWTHRSGRCPSAGCWCSVRPLASRCAVAIALLLERLVYRPLRQRAADPADAGVRVLRPGPAAAQPDPAAVRPRPAPVQQRDPDGNAAARPGAGHAGPDPGVRRHAGGAGGSVDVPAAQPARHRHALRGRESLAGRRDGHRHRRHRAHDLDRLGDACRAGRRALRRDGAGAARDGHQPAAAAVHRRHPGRRGQRAGRRAGAPS